MLVQIEVEDEESPVLEITPEQGQMCVFQYTWQGLVRLLLLQRRQVVIRVYQVEEV